MASEMKEDQKPEIKDETASETTKEDVEKTYDVSVDISGKKQDKKDDKTEIKLKDEKFKDKNEMKDPKEKKEAVSESKRKSKPKEESDDDDEEEEEEKVGLLDRPVEVTGCRARKKVERLEIKFTAKDKEKHEIPEGKGKKLGECPRIEIQIQKTNNQDLRPLHKILFNRIGATNEIKKNIRKFSGFPFEKDSVDFIRRKACIEKLSMKVLKQACLILDIERGGTKDEIVNRLLSFLLNPEDSGKKVPKKKTSKDKPSKGKKKLAGKKSKMPRNNKTEKEGSEEDDANEDDVSGGDNSMGGSDEEMEISNEGEASSDEEPKGKTKAVKAKSKAVKAKKDEKNTKEQKRKLDDSDDDTGKDKPAKKAKMPTDEEISKLVKDILEKADLQEITMKKVIKQVSDAYPDFDLTHKKAFIKSTIKSVIT